MTEIETDNLAEAILMPTEMIPGPVMVEVAPPEPEIPEPVVEKAQEQPEEPEEEISPAIAARGSGWTIPLLCAGLAILASAVLIPQADTNRRIAYECAKLRQDLGHIQTQISTNDEFLHRIVDDPALGERLYQRQMKYVRDGSAILAIDGEAPPDTSPYSLLQVPNPPPMPEYEPVGGSWSAICRGAHSQVFVMGVGLFLLATGLVMGFSPGRRRPLGL